MVKVYDLTGAPVYDPEKAIDYATDITIETMWPKGYGVASFRCRRADVFASWVVKESYGVKIFDGATIVYQGRIETMPKDINGAEEYVTVNCVGWYVLFEERDLRKRWIDVKAISNLRWPDGLELDAVQNSFVHTKRENVLQVFMGTGDIARSTGELYRELYELPSGTVRRVMFDFLARTGEQINLYVWNVDAAAVEQQVVISSTTPVTGSIDYLMVGGPTKSIEMRVRIERSDTYDQNDYCHTSNLRIEANYETGHSAIASPTYTQGQLIEDVILLVNQKGAQLSTDFSQLGDPGFILDPFAVEEPTYAGQVVEKIASYGDVALQTWGLRVMDDSDTSDGLPRVIFEARDVSDYEYEARLGAKELAQLNYEKISSQLYNSTTVQFTNEKNDVRYRTSADNPTLADSASIAAEYQRDHYLKLGQGDTTRADYIGQRDIEYHKDRQTRGTIPLTGLATLKGGGKIPTNRVQAGHRIKLLNTGEIFFIRHTSYNAETKQVRISPDLPQDNIAMLFVQRERALGRLA